jgi:hypothetical protein
MKRNQVADETNLDLNTTAKKGEKALDKASPYLMNVSLTF